MANRPFEALISQAFEDAIDNHRIKREEFHRELWDLLGADGQSVWGRVEAVAEALVSDATELRTDSPTPLEPLRQLRTDVPEDDLNACTTAVILHSHYLIGCDLVRMMRTAERRLLPLFVLAARLNPSYPAAAFLKRVAKCYLFGFDAECVVMCRSVVDREFGSRVSNDDCMTAHPGNFRRNSKGEPLFDLHARIEACRFLKFLDESVLRDADFVREAGRDAVHRWPKFDGDVISVIEKTIRVVRALAEI